MPRKQISLEAKVDIWMPLYISDNGSDTAHLNGDEYRAYMNMQKHQWRHGHMSPEDMANLSLMPRDAWSKSQARLEQTMSSDENGNFYFQKLDLLREESVVRRIKATEKARNAALRRHHRENGGKTGDAPSTPQATPVAGIIPEKGGIKGCPSSLEEKDYSPSASPQGNASAEKTGAGDPGESPSAGMALPAISKPKASPRLDKTLNSEQRGTLPPQNGSKGAASSGVKGDPRTGAFEREFRKFYADMNGVDPKEVPFGPKERTTLRQVLAAEPYLTEDALRTRLANRALAIRMCEAEPKHRGRVNRRDPLTSVMGRSAQYADGPVDAFNQPFARTA